MKKEKVVIVSGYFDPLHVGHLEYFDLAKELGDSLVVIVNNDIQAALKKGRPFMDEKDRLEIVYRLEMVDEAILSIDTDKSVSESLEMISRFKPHAELIFCNGGDRNFGNIPEAEMCKWRNIKMVDGLGKKIRSSSSLTGLVEQLDKVERKPITEVE